MIPATVPLEELKQHRRRDDVWIAIHGKVYNVTEFLDKVGLKEGSSIIASSGSN